MKLGTYNLQKYVKKQKEKKVSQLDIAKSIGCSYSYLNELVRGIKTPSVDMAIRIETATGIRFKDWGKEYVSNRVSISCPYNGQSYRD